MNDETKPVSAAPDGVTPVIKPAVPMPEASTPHRTGGRIVLIGSIFIICIAFAAIAAFYWQIGLEPLFAKRPTPESIKDKMLAVESGVITTRIVMNIDNLPSEGEGGFSLDRLKDVGSIDISSDDRSVSYDFTVSSTFDRSGDDMGSAATISGEFEALGVDVKFDAQTRTVADEVYVRLGDLESSSMPEVFDFVDNFREKWIKLDGLTDSQILEYDQVDAQVEPEAIAREAALLLDAIVEHDVFLATNIERSSFRDQKVWIIDLEIQYEQAIKAYLAAAEKARQEFGENAKLIIYNDDVIDDLMSADEEAVNEAIATIKGMYSETKLQLTVSDDSDILAFNVELKGDLGGYNESLADTRFSLSIASELAEINKPVIIEAPTDAILLVDLIYEAIGLTPEEITQDRQLGYVAELQKALSVYYLAENRYPESLNDLLGYVGQDAYGRTFTVTEIPNDLYTERAFDYESAEELGVWTYELKYLMKFAEVEDSYKYVNGFNTADQISSSQEADLNTDRDGDGLSSYEELRAGTSDYRADTDRDGYTDKEEVDAGFDPLSAGAL